MNITEKRLKELAAISDDQIDYSDIPPLDDDFWKKAEIVYPKNKKSVHLRLDADVLEYFKQQGKGHLTRMNAVLRAYVNAQRNHSSS